MTDNILCERFPSDRQNADITPSSSRDFDTLTGHMESTISSKRGRKLYARKTLLLFSLLLPMTSAQTSPNCIGLAASRTCPSWSSSFISLLNIEKLYVSIATLVGIRAGHANESVATVLFFVSLIPPSSSIMSLRDISEQTIPSQSRGSLHFVTFLVGD